MPNEERPPRRALTAGEINESRNLRDLIALATKLSARMEHRRIDGRDVLQLQIYFDELPADD